MKNSFLLSKIIEKNNLGLLTFTLQLEKNSVPLKNVKISKSPTPVNEPTTRGGAYFSEKEVFKISAIVEDTSVISTLSNYMLGPNTEFKKLHIKIKNNFAESQRTLSIFTNLVNTVQRSKSVELNMILVDMEI